MTTLICILVGLVTIALALAAILGLVYGAFWLGDRIAWRPPAFVERIGDKVMICGVVLFAVLVVYVIGCAVAFKYGWIDDCPTCQVEEATR